MKVELVYDPFGLSATDDYAFVVDDVSSRQTAINAIDNRLRDDDDQSVLRVKIARGFWLLYEKEYSDLQCVRVVFLSPRVLLAEKQKRPVPEWLVDDVVADLGLYHENVMILEHQSWAEWVLSVVFSEYTSNDLGDWLRNAYCCNGLEQLLPGPVHEAFCCRLFQLLGKDYDGVFSGAAFPCRSIHEFVEQVLLAAAYSPLQKCKGQLLAGIHPDVLALLPIPAVFPLPFPLQEQVAKEYVRFVRKQRLANTDFKETIHCLQAIWDGVATEIIQWIHARPSMLSEETAQYLLRLPVPSTEYNLQKTVNLFAPASVPAMDLFEADVDRWANSYFNYLRSAFVRRELPDCWSEDPARAFCEWVPGHITDMYNSDKGCATAAKTIQRALSENRTVIVCMLDAFACHLKDILIAAVEGRLGEPPSQERALYTLLPTITEVCKNSVLTGLAPCNMPSGNLEHVLSQVYHLKEDEILIARQWTDLARCQPASGHKLIIYLDNRIDEGLAGSNSYAALREEAERVFKDVAQHLDLWVRDIRMLQGQKPLVLVTADHGFTYGPPAVNKGMTADALGHHRCCVVKEGVTKKVPSHLLMVDKERFHLKNHWIAAAKRTYGSETISGWVMQHGGVLPEEALVPMVTWYGADKSVYYAEIKAEGKAVRQQEGWQVQFGVNNSHASEIKLIRLELSIQSEQVVKKTVRGLLPGQSRSLECLLPDASFVGDDRKELQVVIRQQVAGQQAADVVQAVEIKRVLMETNDEFEDMF